MTPIDDKLIENVTKTIVENFNPRRIVLFGSHARGEGGPDSDLDVIVEMETEDTVRQAIEILKTFGLRDWAMDLLVYTPAQYARQQKIIGTLPSMIAGEMRILYERSAE